MTLRSTTTAVAVACTFVAASAAQQAPQQTQAPLERGNVLLVVADDVGCDMIASFGAHPAAVPTPNIDAFAATGVSFVSAYTDPVCSPSRACMLTGRYGFRTYLGDAIQEFQPEYSLSQWELTVPEVLALKSPRPVTNAAIGKWHLGSISNGGPIHPNLEGFGYFRGTLGNFFFGQTYSNYTKITNGVASTSTTYASTDQVNDALTRIPLMREPWFMYMGFNGAHKPFHAPPANLHTYALSGSPDATPHEHYRAAVQAMDTEFGRLLASINPEVLARTTVIFIGDNGSPNDVVLAPSIPGQSKGTLYEGGVHVPLIVSGPAVNYPGSRCYAPVNSVDLFPTMLARFNVTVSKGFLDGRPFDGVDLTPYLAQPWRAPLREWVFSTKFVPNGVGPYAASGFMIRDARWKLIERAGQTEQFFDMASPQGEQANLLTAPLTPAQSSAYDFLKSKMKKLIES